MAAHRYWRLHLLGVAAGGTAVRLARAALLSAGAVQLAAGGTASASSTASGSAAAAWAGSGEWASSAASTVSGTHWTAWLGYEMPAGQAIDPVTLALTMSSTTVPACAMLAWSDDEQTWAWTAPVMLGAAGVAAGAVVTVPLPAEGLGVSGARAWGDAYSGAGWIGGVDPVVGVAISGAPDVPVSRRVLVYDAISGQLIRETWSDPAGAWSVPGLVTDRTLWVTAIDDLDLYDPAQPIMVRAAE